MYWRRGFYDLKVAQDRSLSLELRCRAVQPSPFPDAPHPAILYRLFHEYLLSRRLRLSRGATASRAAQRLDERVGVVNYDERGNLLLRHRPRISSPQDSEMFYINSLVPELICSDFEKSLRFYVDCIGFQVAQRRAHDPHAHDQGGY